MVSLKEESSLNDSQTDVRRVDVLVCGGGISGLSLAAWLRRAGMDVVVLDKNAQPGGVIGTIHQDGFIFERGPNTILDKFESFDELITWGGLESEIIRVPLGTQKRHIWLGGRLNEVPTGPLAFLASPLLPLGEKLALFWEPFVRGVREDETVADFVRRRLGPTWLRNLVVPMVSGIWAGDPERMSIEHSFPIMKEMERDGGSILRGALRRMGRARQNRSRQPEAGGRRRRVKNLVSFRDGLQRLPIALAERLGERYQAATRIESIEPINIQQKNFVAQPPPAVSHGSFAQEASQPGAAVPQENSMVNCRFRVRVSRNGQEQTWEARELVIAAEGDHAALWLEPFDAEVARVLRSFPYNRLAVVALGLDAAEARLPEGFGFLAPRGEGLRILGAIVNSNFLPGRAPAGCAALTIFIGGDLDPEAADLSDAALLDQVRRDLGAAVAWRGAPRGVYLERWPRAIPQYDMGHGARLQAIAVAEARWPGLRLVGNWRGGVSIGDRVEYTQGLAREMSEKGRGKGEG